MQTGSEKGQFTIGVAGALYYRVPRGAKVQSNVSAPLASLNKLQSNATNQIINMASIKAPPSVDLIGPVIRYNYPIAPSTVFNELAIKHKP